MSACWASHLYKREICGCVEKAGVGGHSTQGFHLYQVTGNQLPPNPLPTESILKISESVTGSNVSDQCLRRREAKYPPSSTGRRPFWS